MYLKILDSCHESLNLTYYPLVRQQKRPTYINLMVCRMERIQNMTQRFSATALFISLQIWTKSTFPYLFPFKIDILLTLYNNSFFVLIVLHMLRAYDIDISYMLWFVYTLHEHDYTIDHMFNDSCFHTDGQAFFIFSYSEQYHNRKLNNYKLIVYHHTRRPRSILSSLFVVYIIHLHHVYAVESTFFV